MISTFLLTILYFFINGMLGLLPTAGVFSTEWLQAVYTFWAMVNAFSFIVPVQALLTALSIALAFHLAVFLWKVTHWIITKIPFIG